MYYSKPKRAITRVFIHCSNSDYPQHDDISVIRKWHTDPKPEGNGWNDVGYHYFITNSGRLQLGRGLEVTPAAQKWHNRKTVAICLHGKTKFNGAQFKTLKELCKEIHDAHDGAVTFHGHKEVDKGRACPVFDYKSLLKLDGNGKLGV